MLFREGCHQSIGLSSGLPSFAHMYLLAHRLFPFRNHWSHSETDWVVALNVQNVCVCVCSLSCRCCFGLSGLWPLAFLSPCPFVFIFFISVLAGASVSPGLSPIISYNVLTDCVSFQPILYKCVIWLILAQCRLVLHRNTVLKCCLYCSNCELLVPINCTMSFLK